MLTGRTCRKCGEPIKDKATTCRNGCEIYTAVPHGSRFLLPRVHVTGTDGKVWGAGTEGSFVRKPTNNEE